MSPAFASAGEALALISAITSSRLSKAIFRPSRMCALASAFFRSKMVRRVTISFLCSMKKSMVSLSVKTRGRLLTMASMMMPKEDCIWVCL